MLHRYLYLGYRLLELRRFLADARKLREIQWNLLQAKLRRNADSDFGRKHGFSKIRSLADFRRQLPITNYDYVADYVERVKRGEIHALFRPGSSILMFALTSGTTGQSKYIPVTEQFFREYRRGWQLWGIAAYRDHHD